MRQANEMARGNCVLINFFGEGVRNFFSRDLQTNTDQHLRIDKGLRITSWSHRISILNNTESQILIELFN